MICLEPFPDWSLSREQIIKKEQIFNLNNTFYCKCNLIIPGLKYFFVCTVYFVTVPFIKDRILWKTNLCLVVSSSHLEDKKKIPRGYNDFVENEEIRNHFEITSYHR